MSLTVRMRFANLVESSQHYTAEPCRMFC